MSQNKDKYISFDPWWGGYSNIRMSYEIAAAIAHVTKRKLILPHRIYCLFLSQWEEKDTWIDMFSTLDKSLFTENFECVDYEDVPEYAHLESNQQYFDGIEEVAKVICFGDEDNFGPMNGPDTRYFLHCGYTDKSDFDEFANGRTGINLDLEDRFIHFPRNLFGHFYYHVYANSPKERNILKDRMNKGIQYHSMYFDIANDVASKIGDFDAVHIRRNDFLSVRKDHAEQQTQNIVKDLEGRVRPDRPLYVATDERDKSVFDDFRKHYELVFFDDLNIDLQSHEIIMVEQIICSKADTFLGSFLSTFSDYINILRGQSGKKDFHREGTNFNRGKFEYDRFPWLVDEWGWDKTWDYHWKFERQGFNIGIYGSHNASLTISEGPNVLETVEVERWTGVKNAAFCCHFPLPNAKEVLRDIIQYFKDKYDVYIYDNCINNSMPTDLMLLDEIPYLNSIWMPHHKAHVYNAVYQYDTTKALVVTFDGGSDEGHFNIWRVVDKVPEKIYTTTQDICVPYAAVAHYLSPIKQEDNWWWGNLTYAGKIMGLSAYGSFDVDLFQKLKEYYYLQQTDNVNTAHENFQKIFKIDAGHRFGEKESYDLAYNNQKVFEALFDSIVKPYVDEHKDYDLIFAGGGAMNIINNSIWNAKVTPNPDDRGLSFGLLAGVVNPRITDTTYLGSEPYDDMGDTEYISVDEIIDKLIERKIIGFIHDRMEYGARALGRRSIICLPYDGMKDKLNSQVKHREFFRPFAPLCRDVDVHKHFYNVPSNLNHMTHNAFCSNTNLRSVIHEDGSSRLQIVKEDSEPFIYSVLTRMAERKIVPVLLNTSFNVMGKPIINTYKDARSMVESGELDMVVSKNNKLV